VPTLPSTCAVPPDVRRRYQVAVLPVPAAAVPVPLLIAFAASTPPLEAAAKVALQGSVASRFCVVTATSGDAGCVPS